MGLPCAGYKAIRAVATDITSGGSKAVAAIAQALPNDRIALQWDLCQEVIAWEGYYELGPVDFRKETIAELIAIGNGVPA